MTSPDSAHIAIIQQLNKDISTVLKEYEGAVLNNDSSQTVEEIKQRLSRLKKERTDAYAAARPLADKKE